ncbi:archaeal shikimate kinase [Cenarchaeum symbiosum A]|uniref:Shikimate kinase n=1 Tax=Cenarchaeum symbiosum (strain A) TaxID=414004 RepID=A0RU30_CENSY|nr:archaeal shikimate kinase [Cenarchaeum symbiosum A]
MRVRAEVHGAISIVNGIAAGKGATLGIGLRVIAEAEAVPGRGIVIESPGRRLSSRLITKTIERSVPRRELDRNKLRISLDSEIPTGYGLKSSSAISTSVALACMGLFGKPEDSKVLMAGVRASIETKVSITGAYDDACACYYGGFAVTDNYKKRLVRSEKAPSDLGILIFIPRGKRRGKPLKLRPIKGAFEAAWSMAKRADYWGAMLVNGLAAAPILGPDPELLVRLMERGALGASVSGNGPAVAAVVRKGQMGAVRKVFSDEGRIITSSVNNRKADVREL